MFRHFAFAFVLSLVLQSTVCVEENRDFKDDDNDKIHDHEKTTAKSETGGFCCKKDLKSWPRGRPETSNFETNEKYKDYHDEEENSKKSTTVHDYHEIDYDYEITHERVTNQKYPKRTTVQNKPEGYSTTPPPHEGTTPRRIRTTSRTTRTITSTKKTSPCCDPRKKTTPVPHFEYEYDYEYYDYGHDRKKKQTTPHDYEEYDEKEITTTSTTIRPFKTRRTTTKPYHGTEDGYKRRRRTTTMVTDYEDYDHHIPKITENPNVDPCCNHDTKRTQKPNVNYDERVKRTTTPHPDDCDEDHEEDSNHHTTKGYGYYRPRYPYRRRRPVNLHIRVPFFEMVLRKGPNRPSRLGVHVFPGLHAGYPDYYRRRWSKK